MKVAYVIYPDALVSGRSNGVRSQALVWKDILESKGICVDLINCWEHYNWRDYDVVHYFGPGPWIEHLSARLRSLVGKSIYSPIEGDFAPMYNLKKEIFKKKLAKFTNRRWYNPFIERSYELKNNDLICVRSDFEADFIATMYDFPRERMVKIPLSFTMGLDDYFDNNVEHEDFVLHISSIYQERKNVKRLIRAAKKFHFNLLLAGNKGNEEQFKPIKDEIGDAENIQVLGFISEEEKISLYKKARVFALPSTMEGVGIVALDAAALGCDVAITNLGGPKEYYSGMVSLVDPYSVDSIGNGIVDLFNSSKQPELSKYVRENFSPSKIGDMLIEMYM